jgi:hypothetical protein
MMKNPFPAGQFIGAAAFTALALRRGERRAVLTKPIEPGNAPGSRIERTQSGAVYEVDSRGTRRRRKDLEK